MTSGILAVCLGGKKPVNRMRIFNHSVQARVAVLVLVFLLGHLGLMILAPAVNATDAVDAHHLVSIERCDAADEDMTLTGSMPGMTHIAIAVSVAGYDLLAGDIDALRASVAPAPDATAQRVASQLFLN